MKATRISRIIIVAVIMIAVIVALQVFNITVISKESSQNYVGMGDLRRYEAQTTSRPYVGMGDLRRYEAMQEQRDAVQPGSLSP